MTNEVVIFDAFGTLFNLDTTLLKDIGHSKKNEILAYTREKQLSYTWLFSLMKTYESFEDVTYRALKDALKKFDAPQSLLEEFASLYMKPVVFDDVQDCLNTLVANDKKTGILSNGTKHMLATGIKHNNLEPLIQHVFSVEDVSIFKPDPMVYNMVTTQLDKMPSDITFVSSNQWDVAGANAFGFQTIWVNRAGLFRESIIRDEGILEVSSLLEIK